MWFDVGSHEQSKSLTQARPPLQLEYCAEVFLFSSWYHYQRLLKVFHKLFSHGWDKIGALSPFPEVCHFSGLQDLQNTLNTNTLKHHFQKDIHFYYSNTYCTNLQYISWTEPTGTQLHFIQLVLHVSRTCLLTPCMC